MMLIGGSEMLVVVGVVMISGGEIEGSGCGGDDLDRGGEEERVVEDWVMMIVRLVMGLIKGEGGKEIKRLGNDREVGEIRG